MNQTDPSERDQRVQQDEEVLRMLQADAPDAAERLVAVFGDRIYGLSLRILGSEEDAKECVQESFLTIWRKWKSFKERSQFSSWVYRLAANQAFMKLRKRRRFRNDVSLEELDEAGGRDPQLHLHQDLSSQLLQSYRSPDQELAQRELNQLILQAVEELPDIYRSAYVMKDLEGLSLKEIAEIMEISEPAAKSRVHRARLELRSRLAPYLG